MTSFERQYLLDILIAAEHVLAYVGEMTYDEFEEDSLVRDAVMHRLTIIGEAARRIERLTEVEVPRLPWRQMKNLRNVLVHEYEGINLPTIWTIITTDLRQAVAVLDPLFPERKQQ